MNKYQEVIENVCGIILDRNGDGIETPRFLSDFYPTECLKLRELVDKATPKKPNKLDYKLLLDEGWNYECPICKCAIGINTKAIDYTQEEGYCPTCGQAIDWTSDE